MKAGTLRNRITFQRPVNTTDPAWGSRTEWQDFVTCWAAVEPAQAAESVEANGVQSKTALTIRVRYAAGIKPEHRIQYQGRTLDIVSLLTWANATANWSSSRGSITMPKGAMQLQGDRQLAKLFGTLADKVQRKVMRQAVNAAVRRSSRPHARRWPRTPVC
jgi:SPP1 family predicted phage head-tail adaptor